MNIFKHFFSSDKKISYAIKNIFGFYPGNVFLYKQALLHKSAVTDVKKNEYNNNERLEYLGDAILSSIISDYLFKKFPYKNEGFLTEMRSKIVNRSHLNKLAQDLKINSIIISDKHLNINNPHNSVGGNAFESLIGAIYIDKGYDFTYRIMINKILKHHVNIEELDMVYVNYKSKLIEWCQKEKKSIEFKIKNPDITGHDKKYIAEVYINNSYFGRGYGFSIKNAEQNASEEAYKKINPVNL